MSNPRRMFRCSSQFFCRYCLTAVLVINTCIPYKSTGSTKSHLRGFLVHSLHQFFSTVTAICGFRHVSSKQYRQYLLYSLARIGYYSPYPTCRLLLEVVRGTCSVPHQEQVLPTCTSYEYLDCTPHYLFNLHNLYVLLLLPLFLQAR
jgi:hypothetical protein